MCGICRWVERLLSAYDDPQFVTEALRAGARAYVLKNKDVEYLIETVRLVAEGRIPRDESIVICVTGNGYKTLEAVLDGVEQPSRIPARLADFDALYAQLRGGREASAG